VWSEQSIAIEALSCGWDDGAKERRALRQTRALIEAWWSLHKLAPEPMNFLLTLPKAWKYTEKARREVAERKQNALDERESKKSYHLIGTFLSELKRPATLQEIAAATGLSSGAVRQQLSRLVRRTEDRGRDPGYFRESRGLYSFRVRGSK
jgi:DNA-directed RNA polymerase specialized sigma24 family protein